MMDLVLAHPLIWNMFLGLGSAMSVIFAAMAFGEESFKKSLVYLAVSAAGWSLILFMLNTPLTLKCAWMMLGAQALGLTGLALSAKGNSGYAKAAYGLCAFSVIGMPPFLGFWPRLFTFISVVSEGYLWLSGLLGVAMVLILLTVLKGFDKFGPEDGKVPVSSYAALALGSVSLVLGFIIIR
jgi:formate hydrogenlyase subunit 3/multisubunit Na+/H+ antiporter MnhD subunit